MTVVTETLDCLMRKPTTAAFFIYHLKKYGFKHDVFSYMAIIRFLCSWDMIRMLNKMIIVVIEDEVGTFDFYVWDLFELLVKEINVVGCSFLGTAVDGFIKLFVSIGRFSEALDMLLSTCNLFLKRLVEAGEVDMALVVYGHLKMNGYCPDVYTYMNLIKLLMSKNLENEVRDLYVEMQEARVDPQIVSFGSYINGLCSNGGTDFAFNLLKVRGSHPFVDGFPYSSVICGFVKESQLEDGEDVIRYMEQFAIIPDANCYGVLVQGYRKKGNIDKAIDLHAEMTSKGIKTNCVMLTSIMQCYCSQEFYMEAVELFINAKKEGLFLDEVCFNITIDALCKSGEMIEAILLLEEMKFRLMKHGVKHYTTLINGFCLLKDLESALKTLKKMYRKGLKPDAITLNVLISGFSRCGLIDEAMVHFDNRALHISLSLKD